MSAASVSGQMSLVTTLIPPLPSRVNLTALLARFVRTWRSRISSPMTKVAREPCHSMLCGSESMRSSRETSSPRFFAVVATLSEATRALMARWKWNGCDEDSKRPASMRCRLWRWNRGRESV